MKHTTPNIQGGEKTTHVDFLPLFSYPFTQTHTKKRKKGYHTPAPNSNPTRTQPTHIQHRLSQTKPATQPDLTSHTIQTYKSPSTPKPARTRLASTPDFPESFLLHPFESENPPQDPQNAGSLRKLGTKPPPNTVQLSKSHGIHVASPPGAAASTDTFSCQHSNTPHIFLTRSKTPERAHFDIAHEIGHLIMHRYHGAQTAGNASSVTAKEREADTPTSELLTPHETIFEHPRPNPPISDLLRVARALVISAMALAYAAHKADRMND